MTSTNILDSTHYPSIRRCVQIPTNWDCNRRTWFWFVSWRIRAWFRWWRGLRRGFWSGCWRVPCKLDSLEDATAEQVWEIICKFESNAWFKSQQSTILCIIYYRNHIILLNSPRNYVRQSHLFNLAQDKVQKARKASRKLLLLFSCQTWLVLFHIIW